MLYTAAKELIGTPPEFKVFDLALDKLRDDPRITLLIGPTITGAGRCTPGTQSPHVARSWARGVPDSWGQLPGGRAREGSAGQGPKVCLGNPDACCSWPGRQLLWLVFRLKYWLHSAHLGCLLSCRSEIGMSSATPSLQAAPAQSRPCLLHMCMAQQHAQKLTVDAGYGSNSMNRRARRHIANRQFSDAQGLQHTQVCSTACTAGVICSCRWLQALLALPTRR